MKRILVLRLIALLVLYGSVSLYAEEYSVNLHPEALVDTFTMPVDPILDNLGVGDYDLYASEPSRITYLKKDYGSPWSVLSIEVIEYIWNETEQIKTLHIRSFDEEDTLEDYDIVEYHYSGDYLDSLVINRGGDNSTSNRKEIEYFSKRTLINHYLDEKLYAKYLYRYNEKGLLDSYSKESHNSFSGKWENDFIRSYLYDDQGRLIRTFLQNSDSPDEIISYNSEGNIEKITGIYDMEFKSDSNGRIINRKMFTPFGQYEEESTSYNYVNGRISSIVKEYSLDDEVVQSLKHVFEY